MNAILSCINKKEKKTTGSENYDEAIKLLKEKDCIYTKADKGNSLVILNKQDYIERGQIMLDGGNYDVLDRNPLNKMVEEVRQLLKEVENVYGRTVKWSLLVSNPRIPMIYFLPKIHKPGNKVRPIVSNIDAPTYKLAKWILREFEELTPPKSKSIKNSFEFVKHIEDITLENDEIMISFDVVSLFPSIPLEQAISFVSEWLVDSTLSDEKVDVLFKAIKVCLKQNYFQFENKFYSVKEGTNMGHPISPWIANLFMGYFEITLESQDLLPRYWVRYVDDIFAVVKRCEVDKVLEILNCQYHSIKFTVEMEENGGLNFLDLHLERKNNRIEVDIFRKETSTKRFITVDSFCPWQQKMASFNSMVFRMCKLPLSFDKFEKELKIIKEIAVINGFKENVVDKMVFKHKKKLRQYSMTTFFESIGMEGDQKRRIKLSYYPAVTNKLSNILKTFNIQTVFSSKMKLKDMLPNGKQKLVKKNEKPGIYSIKCSDCDLVYVGQTKRSIETRFKEHMGCLRSNAIEKSAVAQHAFHHKHGLSIGNLKLIKHVTDNRMLNAYESLYMKKFENVLMNVQPPPINSFLFDFVLDCG